MYSLEKKTPEVNIVITADFRHHGAEEALFMLADLTIQLARDTNMVDHLNLVVSKIKCEIDDSKDVNYKYKTKGI